MTTAQVVLIVFGLLCVVTSVVFIVKKIGDSGTNQLTLLGQSFNLTGSALVFLVVGAMSVYLGASYGPAPDSAATPNVQTGQIEGMVKSTSGVGLPGVRVLIVNMDTQTRTEVMTDGGLYKASDLPLGSYGITARQLGLKAATGEIELRLLAPNGTANFILEEFSDEDVRGLMSAVENGNLKSIQNYLEQGLPPDRLSTERDQDTALALAAALGKEDAVKALLEGGADPNRRMRSGSLPLIEAAYVGNAAIVRLLLEHKAEPNAKKQDGSGDTALMFACIQGHDDIVNLLVSTPALSPNDTNDAGQTALGFAKALPASPVKDRIVASLLSVGAH